jgi:hypothetical protein
VIVVITRRIWPFAELKATERALIVAVGCLRATAGLGILVV